MLPTHLSHLLMLAIMAAVTVALVYDHASIRVEEVESAILAAELGAVEQAARGEDNAAHPTGR